MKQIDFLIIQHFILIKTQSINKIPAKSTTNLL
jgi:hypothetical protein